MKGHLEETSVILSSWLGWTRSEGRKAVKMISCSLTSVTEVVLVGSETGCERRMSGGHDYRFIIWHSDFEKSQGNPSANVSLKVWRDVRVRDVDMKVIFKKAKNKHWEWFRLSSQKEQGAGSSGSRTLENTPWGWLHERGLDEEDLPWQSRIKSQESWKITRGI